MQISDIVFVKFVTAQKRTNSIKMRGSLVNGLVRIEYNISGTQLRAEHLSSVSPEIQ